MPARTADPQAPAWAVGDRAIVDPTPGSAAIEATVTALFRITDADATKLRIKYPWIKAGEIVLVLIDDGGRQYRRIASDPALRRIISNARRQEG